MTEEVDTIKDYCPTCGTYADAIVLERDADGWPSSTRWADPEHDRRHELAEALEGLVEHSAAAMNIGIEAGDWALASENAERVLRLNDGREP